jgi:hypothetical protein
MKWDILLADCAITGSGESSCFMEIIRPTYVLHPAHIPRLCVLTLYRCSVCATVCNPTADRTSLRKDVRSALRAHRLSKTAQRNVWVSLRSVEKLSVVKSLKNITFSGTRSIHHHIHKSALLVTILRQVNPINPLQSCLLRYIITVHCEFTSF